MSRKSKTVVMKTSSGHYASRAAARFWANFCKKMTASYQSEWPYRGHVYVREFAFDQTHKVWYVALQYGNCGPANFSSWVTVYITDENGLPEETYEDGEPVALGHGALPWCVLEDELGQPERVEDLVGQVW